VKRREFGQKLGGAVIGAALVPPATASAQPVTHRANTLMHAGGDYHSVAGRNGITSKENLEYNLRHGVKHLTAQIRNRPESGGWDPDELKRMKDDCDRYGVILEAIRMDAEYITLSKGAERDGQLDTIIGNIRKAADVGVENHHVSLDRDSHPTQRAHPGPGRIELRSLQARGGLEETARDKIRAREFRRLLGTHHSFSGEGRPGRQTVRSENGLSPVRSAWPSVRLSRSR